MKKRKKRKWSLREKLLFAAPLLPLLLIFMDHFYSQDSLDRKVEELAGPDAVSCGVRSYYGPFDDTDACMATAIQSGRAVWARYDQEVDPPAMYAGNNYLAQAKIYKPTDSTGRNMPAYFVFYVRSYGRFGIPKDHQLEVTPATCNLFMLEGEGLSIACG